MPRFRWAGRSIVMTDPAQRVAALAAGIPADTVVLDDASAPSAQSSTATLDILQDQPGAITVSADSTGDGYLVIGDAIARDGWEAEVDGQPVRIWKADHAMAGVELSGGTHVVTLRYEAPGLRLGVATTAGALLLGVALLTIDAFISRRRRRRDDLGEDGTTSSEP
jgi:hypothetical protein